MMKRPPLSFPAPGCSDGEPSVPTRRLRAKSSAELAAEPSVAESFQHGVLITPGNFGDLLCNSRMVLSKSAMDRIQVGEKVWFIEAGNKYQFQDGFKWKVLGHARLKDKHVATTTWVFEDVSQLGRAKYIPRTSDRVWVKVDTKTMTDPTDDIQRFMNPHTTAQSQSSKGPATHLGDATAVLQTSPAEFHAKADDTPTQPTTPPTDHADGTPADTVHLTAKYHCDAAFAAQDETDGKEPRCHPASDPTSGPTEGPIPSSPSSSHRPTSLMPPTPSQLPAPSQAELPQPQPPAMTTRHTYGESPNSWRRPSAGAHHHPRPEVRDLSDMFSWASDYLDILEHVCPPGILHDLKTNIEETDRSSAFSGIDAPGVANCVLAHALSDRLHPTHVHPSPHRAATEWNKQCQQELLDHPNAPDHLFTDVEEFWTPEVRKTIQTLKDNKVTINLDSLMCLIIDGVGVQDVAHCAVHNGLCQHPRAKVHEAGPPCVNFSPMGNRDTTDGHTMTQFAAWASLRHRLQEPILIIEESDHLPPEVIARVFGKYYHVDWKVVDPTLLGWCGRRPRFWAACFHKSYVLQIYNHLDNVIELFRRNCQCSWRELLVAESHPVLKDELEAEITWASKRPKSQHRHDTRDILSLPQPFHAVLTEKEAEYLAFYQRSRPHCCVMLNQNPASGFGIASTPDVLHTLIRNPAFHWSLDDHRWLSASEMLMAQCFPVLPRLANPRGSPARCTSFCAGGHLGPRDRSRQHVVAQAGNSMNVSVCGFMRLFVLMWATRADQSRVASLFG